MSLEKQLEHIIDEIDAARNRVTTLQERVNAANWDGARVDASPITYNELGKDRDLLRHAGGSLNYAIRVIAGIMANGGK